jgi:hypothetical protein
VAAAKAPDFVLDAALFMGAVDADDRELRLEQVVRSQRDEAV